MAPGWPRFVDADVEIRLSKSVEDHFRLHSYILALYSPVFKASLSKRWGEGHNCTTAASDFGPTNVQAIYELRFDSDDMLGMVSRQGHDPDHTEMLPGNTEGTTMNTSNPDQYAKRLESLEAHRNLLGTLYHLPPLVDAENFLRAKSAVSALVAVADMYDCRHVVALHLDGCLRRTTPVLLSNCRRDPVDMLRLAISIKSAWIFQEAATHLLGRSKRFFEAARAELVALGIADLMDNKRSEFVNKLVSVEHRLLARPHSFADNRLFALAEGFFRHWLSSWLDDGHGSKLGPGYGSVYHDICQPNISTSSEWKTLVNEWLGFIDYHHRGADPDLMRRVEDVFRHAADIVRPLRAQVTLIQDNWGDSYRALTCMKVDESELPWVSQV